MNNEGAEQSKMTAEVLACHRREIDRITVRISIVRYNQRPQQKLKHVIDERLTELQ